MRFQRAVGFLLKLVGYTILMQALAGCASWRLGPYVSPRVTGRVVAADTQLPLAGVAVRRPWDEAHSPGWSPKGGELLMQKEPVRTDREGHFTLASEQVLSVVSFGGWSMVSMTFERAGYRKLHTNFSATAQTTISRAGEPELQVGDVPLSPVSLPAKHSKP